jgi:hypothetical protein
LKFGGIPIDNPPQRDKMYLQINQSQRIAEEAVRQSRATVDLNRGLDAKLATDTRRYASRMSPPAYHLGSL